MATKLRQSANETLVDLFTERAIDILRLEAGTASKVRRLLRALESEIVKAIAGVDPTGPTRFRYQRERLAKLQRAVTAAIAASYRDVNVLMTREVREIIDLEAAWTNRTIGAVLPTSFVDAGLTRGMLDVLVSDVLVQGAPTKTWWQRQAAGLSDRFADEMRRGVALGETNAKLIQRVRGDGAAQRGIMDISYAGAERIVRSSVQTAANVAREAMYDQNDDLITMLKWHATLDTRTSHWCIVRDSLNYEPKTHKPIGHTVPWLEGPGKIHWMCRSTSVPVLKSWRELGIDMDDLPETTRASIDGQVPAKQSFEEWLKKQSVERQNTVLGVGKADLWRRGKITFRDLLDQNGRPLTTEELRAKMAGKP